jgi:hypothetical protein
MVARGLFALDEDLAALRQFKLEECARVEAEPLPQLSREHQHILEQLQRLGPDEAQAETKGVPIEVSFVLSMKGTREVARDPYAYSDLAWWLGLETWKPREALLLLAGVSPKAAVVDWTYENFMGVEIDRPTIRAAVDLNAVYDNYDVPTRDAWDDDIADVQRILREGKESLTDDRKKALEDKLSDLKEMRDGPEVVRRATELRHRSNILDALSSQWFSGDHDAEKRYSPDHFIGWASARGFKPEWYDWASKQGLIDVHADVYRAPFFDPESEDYPELLHIAVRAWEAARTGGEGTPKQRVERFLQERHPGLPSNTRRLIAQVANWQRTGGRPKR